MPEGSRSAKTVPAGRIACKRHRARRVRGCEVRKRRPLKARESKNPKKLVQGGPMGGRGVATQLPNGPMCFANPNGRMGVRARFFYSRREHEGLRS